MQKKVINIFLIVNLIIGIYLTASALLFSWNNIELADEYVYKNRDNFIVNILGLLFVFTIVAVFSNRQSFLKEVSTRKIAIILGIVAVVISVCWVVSSKTAPQADAKYVCEAASRFNVGDYFDMGRGEYVAKYPQQLGLITLMRILFKLFGDYNYLSFQILSCLAVFPIIYCTYEIAGIISNNNRVVEMICLVISFTCLPIYMYTAYVYGEILSTACIIISFMMILKCFQQPTKARLIGLAIAVMLAVMIRQNSLIAIIAMLAISLFNCLLKDKRKISLMVLVAIIVGVMSHSILIKGLYENKWPDDATHLHTLLWVAMGMNNDRECAGWNNGMPSMIFDESNFDEEACKDAAMLVISNFKNLCMDNPRFAADFYNRKITSQWCAPMYQGIVMNSYIVGEQHGLTYAIFNNKKVWKVLDNFMNLYQLVIYVSMLAFIFHYLKKKDGAEIYIGLLTIFGGFLFSILWEAKTRYVFPYFVIMLPYAAVGIYLLSKDLIVLKEKIKKN